MVKDAGLSADDVASNHIYLVAARFQHDILLIDGLLSLSHGQLIVAVSRRLHHVFKVAFPAAREPGEPRVDIDAPRVDSALVLK